MQGGGADVWAGPCWEGTTGRGRGRGVGGVLLGWDCRGGGEGGPALRAGAWVLTQVAEDHWQQDQAVQQAQHSDEEVEAEEEDLDELRLRQAQHEDARQVGHGHASEHLGVTGRREAKQAVGGGGGNGRRWAHSQRCP